MKSVFPLGFRHCTPLLFLLTACLVFSGCHSVPDHARVLPEDCFVVVSFNSDNLMTKSEFERSAVFDNMISSIDGELRDLAEDLVEDPAQFGIDQGENMYGFALLDDNETYGGIVMALKNKQLFEDGIDELDIPRRSIEREASYTTVTMGDEGVFGWNDHMFAMLAGEYYADEESLLKMIEDMLKENPDEMKENTLDDFASFSSQPHDVGAWLNMYQLGKILKEDMGRADFRELGIKSSQMRDSYAHLYLTFEEDEVILKGSSVLGEKWPQELKVSLPGSIDKQLLSFLPGEDLIGAAATSIDLEELLDGLLQNDLIDGIADEIRRETGIDAEEVVASMQGDFVASFRGQIDVDYNYMDSKYEVYDTIVERYNSRSNRYEQVETQERRYYREKETEREEELGFVISGTLSNRDAFDAIVETIEEELSDDEDEELEHEGDHYTFIPAYGNTMFFGLANGKIFYITNDEEVVEAAMEGGFNGSDRVSGEVAGILQGNSLGAFLDIENARDIPYMEEEFQEFLEVMTDLTFESDGENLEIHLHLEKDGTNSLATFLDVIEDLM